MTTRRTQIVEALVSDIHTNVTRILSANVTRQMVFLNEVNDFPFVCMLVEPETRFHYGAGRSEEHTSELQSQSTISYAVFCLKKKK